MATIGAKGRSARDLPDCTFALFSPFQRWRSLVRREWMRFSDRVPGVTPLPPPGWRVVQITYLWPNWIGFELTTFSMHRLLWSLAGPNRTVWIIHKLQLLKLILTSFHCIGSPIYKHWQKQAAEVCGIDQLLQLSVVNEGWSNWNHFCCLVILCIKSKPNFFSSSWQSQIKNHFVLIFYSTI